MFYLRYLNHITFLSGIQAPLFMRPGSALKSPQPAKLDAKPQEDAPDVSEGLPPHIQVIYLVLWMSV